MKLENVILAGFLFLCVGSIAGIKGEVRSTPKSPDIFIYIQSAPTGLDVYLIPDSLIPEKQVEGEKS